MRHIDTALSRHCPAPSVADRGMGAFILEGVPFKFSLEYRTNCQQKIRSYFLQQALTHNPGCTSFLHLKLKSAPTPREAVALAKVRRTRVKQRARHVLL